MGREAGYSIVELIIATGVSLSVLASTLTLVGGVQSSFANQSERADMQQRLRVASDALYKDLLMAGAGPYQGAHAGALDHFVAPVLPFRQGAVNTDSPGTFRTDTLTAVYVPPATAAQTTIRQPMPAQSGSVSVNIGAGCPPNDPSCGFNAGMDVMIYDETASYDTFRITSVQGGILQLHHNMIDTPRSYAAGAAIVEVTSYTYYLRTDAATDTSQLMRYDGVSSDALVVDHIVGLTFDYDGDPFPPVLVKPITEPTGPWTTYGPKPPPLGVRPTTYPAGENCAFQLDSTGLVQIPRLAALGGGTTTLVRLTAAQLTDGPWCPDPTSPHRFDADLLRIRTIVVTLRLETALSALRGPAGVLFTHGGTSRSANRWVPDQEIRFPVSPRNLNLAR